MKRRLTRIRNLIALIALIGICSLVFFAIQKTKYVDTKEKLVRKTIEIALGSHQIPDYDFIKDKHNIIVSSENIEHVSIQPLKNANFIVLSPKKIKEKANREGDFLYLNFKKINIGFWHAEVSLDNIWAVADSSKKMYLSGGGLMINYFYLFGKWHTFNVGMWISFDPGIEWHHFATGTNLSGVAIT